MGDALVEVPGYAGYFITRSGSVSNRSGLQLKPNLTMRYPKVSIRNRQGVSKMVSIHRLVAAAWLPNEDPSRSTVNHIDGDPRNYHADNLEWVSLGDNIRHAVATGLRSGATAQGRRVRRIDPSGRLPSETFSSVCAAASAHGCHPSSIQKAVDVPDRKSQGCFWRTEPVPESAEEWRPVVSCDGISLGYMPYEVSDEGKVRNSKTNKLLHPKLDHSGYCRVWLCTAKGNDRCFLVHRLVAAAFIGCADPRGYDVDHINGAKADNRPGNLQYLRRGDHNKKTHGTPIARVAADGSRTVYPTKTAAAAGERVSLRTIRASLASGAENWVAVEPAAARAQPHPLTDEEIDSILAELL